MAVAGGIAQSLFTKAALCSFSEQVADHEGVAIGEEVLYHLAILIARESFTTDEREGTGNIQSYLSMSSGVPATPTRERN